MLASRRNARGASDPLRLTCACDNKGVVVLFYKYVQIDSPASVVARIVEFGESIAKGAVTGKIRVAREGINATAAADDEKTMLLFTSFIESIDELKLRERGGGVDYKPEPGCRHAFPTLSARVVEELCPFGERELSTSETCGGDVQSVSPRAWHEALMTRREEEMSVIDARNFYESRVGAFGGSVLAPIRRFSQLKEWLERDGVVDAHVAGKDVYIYCTGGVRCEKVATYLATRLDEKSKPKSVRKLAGGVVAYAKEFGRAKESLFKGSNFVFDARGSVPVGPENELPETSWCDGCRAPSGRLSKCVGVRCHVVLIACDACGDTVYCCEGCREQTVKSRGVEKFKRRPCECDCFESRERRCAAPSVDVGASLGGARKRSADA